MVTNKNLDEGFSEPQKHIEILEQRLALLKEQMALDTANQTQQSQLAKATMDALKDQASAQFAMESERGKLPFAELAGIKAALSDAKLPEGKIGSVQIAVGTAGTALLRSKKQMFELLDLVADALSAQLPNGAVIVTDAQLEQAYRCQFVLKIVEEQTKTLEETIDQSMPKIEVESFAPPMVLAPFIAGAYSVGLVLDTVNSLAKLFRVDRKVDIFAADTEARELLGYMLEGKNSMFSANPAMVSEAVIEEAGVLMQSLNRLLQAVQSAKDTLEQLKKVEEGANIEPPSADIVASLKSKLEAANTLIEGLQPGKKPDELWAQVKGQLIWRSLTGRKRLMLEAKAQAIQITESRWWRSDRICTSGEVQVLYRILDEHGKMENSGVILKTSRVEKNDFINMSELSFPKSK